MALPKSDNKELSFKEEGGSHVVMLRKRQMWDLSQLKGFQNVS